MSDISSSPDQSGDGWDDGTVNHKASAEWNSGAMPSSHSDYIRIDWQSMDAARKKYRAAVVKAEKQPGCPLVHTLYKLGQFLDDATYGAFRLSEERAPDTPEELTS